MSELKPAARRWIFVLLATGLVAGAVPLFGRLVLFYKPWRTSEVVILSAVTVASGFAASWISARRPKLRVTWLALIATGWLLVGATYFFSYRTNRKANIRAVLEYVDSSRIPSLAGDPDTPPGVEELAGHFRTRPPLELERLPRISNQIGHGQLQARDLMASEYHLRSFPAVTLPDDLSWDEDPLGDPSWTLELHNMEAVAALARAYSATAHLPYMERAEALMLDWIKDNASDALGPPSEFAWHHHGTAIRLASWLYFWEVWSKSPAFTPRKMAHILGSMLAHAERLASVDFYQENHNSGIDQDRALLGFALLFPELNRSDDWRELALRRLALQLEGTISSNGVHLEHSPGYHLFQMGKLHDIARVLRDFGLEDEFALDLEGLHARMARFAAATLMPTGRVAPIGDTGRTPIDRYVELKRHAADPWLGYHFTGGRSGLLRDTVLAYPEEGYAIIRDFAGGALPYDRSFYLFFTSAAHEVTGLWAHKHADEVSFVLTYEGRDYLIDPGGYSYKRDEGRAHVVSSRAHNVVLVDGKNFSGFDSSFDGFSNDPNHTAIRGSHRNYRDFEHRRWVIHVKPAKIFVVDEVLPLTSNQGVHRFEQLFHFAEDLNVQAQGTEVIAKPGNAGDDAPSLRLTQLRGSVDARVVSGQREPMLGWSSPEHGVLEPAPVAVFTTSGEKALYVTRIDFVTGDEADTTSRAAETVRLSEDGGLLITWSGARGTGRLRVDTETGNVEFAWQ